jgi:trehalose 6-phosphate phosphatase
MATASLPPFAPGWAIFLDVDGTLLEHAERPDAVRAEPAVLRLLEALRRGTHGALALISGRAITDLDRLFAPLALPLAGQHGVERRDAAGRLHRHAFPADLLRRAAARIGEFAARHEGLLFEDKGYNLALHFRLAPQLAGAAQSAVRAAAAQLGGEFEVQEGRMVVELKPSGRDKGVAIEEFMREPPFAGRRPVFIGDDLTDEFGFGVVNRLGGHAVKVGPGPSAAPFRLADAAAVRAWLEAWTAHHA